MASSSYRISILLFSSSLFSKKWERYYLYHELLQLYLEQKSCYLNIQTFILIDFLVLNNPNLDHVLRSKYNSM